MFRSRRETDYMQRSLRRQGESVKDKRIEFFARQIRRDQVSFEVSELGWLRSNCLQRDTHPTDAGTLLRLTAAGSACGGRKCGRVHQGIECESGRTRCRVVAARRRLLSHISN